MTQEQRPALEAKMAMALWVIEQQLEDDMLPFVCEKTLVDPLPMPRFSAEADDVESFDEEHSINYGSEMILRRALDARGLGHGRAPGIGLPLGSCG